MSGLKPRKTNNHGIQYIENNYFGSVSHLPSPPWWQHCPIALGGNLPRQFCSTGVLLSVPAPRLAPDLLGDNILPQLQDISISLYLYLYLYLYIFLNYQIIWEVDTISQFLILTLFPIFTLVVRNKNVWNQNLRKGKKVDQESTMRKSQSLLITLPSTSEVILYGKTFGVLPK